MKSILIVLLSCCSLIQLKAQQDNLLPLKKCFEKYASLESYYATIRQTNYDSSLNIIQEVNSTVGFTKSEYFAKNSRLLVLAQRGLQLSLDLKKKEAVLSPYDTEHSKREKSLAFLQFIDTNASDIKVKHEGAIYSYRIKSPYSLHTYILVKIDSETYTYEQVQITDFHPRTNRIFTRLEIDFLNQDFSGKGFNDRKIEDYVSGKGKDARLKAPYSDYKFYNLQN